MISTASKIVQKHCHCASNLRVYIVETMGAHWNQERSQKEFNERVSSWTVEGNLKKEKLPFHQGSVVGVI
jgi:hypothetical protein